MCVRLGDTRDRALAAQTLVGSLVTVVTYDTGMPTMARSKG